MIGEFPIIIYAQYNNTIYIRAGFPAVASKDIHGLDDRLRISNINNEYTESLSLTVKPFGTKKGVGNTEYGR